MIIYLERSEFKVGSISEAIGHTPVIKRTLGYNNTRHIQAPELAVHGLG